MQVCGYSFKSIAHRLKILPAVHQACQVLLSYTQILLFVAHSIETLTNEPASISRLPTNFQALKKLIYGSTSDLSI